MAALTDLWRTDSGISSVEYALLLAMIAGGIIVAIDALGNAVESQLMEKAKCLRDSTGVYLDPACNN